MFIGKRGLIDRLSRGQQEAGEQIVLKALRFPSNGDSPLSTAVAFDFTGSNLISPVPATVIWKVKPVQQTGYYTTFFHAWSDNEFTSANTYYGCHPYPPGGSSGTTHNWEISIAGTDDYVDDNGNSTTVTKDAWYTQACVTTEVATNALYVAYYWNLAVSTNRIITYQDSNGSADEFAPYSTGRTPAMTWGDAPWNVANERLSGDLGAIKIFSAALDLSDIVSEAADMTQIVTSAGSSSRWWFKPTYSSVDDLTDSVTGKSANWVTGSKATLVDV